MSITDNNLDQDTDQELDLPDFELSFLFNDLDDPKEVTIFPSRSNEITTQWITIDFDHAVPLAEIR